jgi:hypothetical protein
MKKQPGASDLASRIASARARVERIEVACKLMLEITIEFDRVLRAHYHLPMARRARHRGRNIP